MRKIEKAIANAIRTREPVTTANTIVSFDPVIGGAEMEVRLHGYLIAKEMINGDIAINLCGWNTRITRSRLDLVIRTLADMRRQSMPGMSVADAVKDAAGPYRYPRGLGVSSRGGIVRLHDARGETPITETEWHYVQL